MKLSIIALLIAGTKTHRVQLSAPHTKIWNASLAEVQDTPHEVELKIPEDKKLSSEKALTTSSSPLEKVIVDKSKTTEKDAAEQKLKDDKFKDDKDCKNC